MGFGSRGPTFFPSRIDKRIYREHTKYTNTTKNIKAGTKFRILLGMPRDCTVTRVTAAKVYYESINEAGEAQHFITPRSMFSNPAMIAVTA